MAWLSDKEFKQEHITLPRILRTGSKAAREKEADKQEAEVKEMADKEKNEEAKEVKKGMNIRRLEIEPAENGGFVVRVMHKEKESRDGKMPATLEEPDLHAYNDLAGLHGCIDSCFPSSGGKTRTKKGKSETKEKGGSRMDTYEGGQGDEVGE